MIRQVLPSLVAHDIIGVQPMSIGTKATPIETGESYINDAGTVEFYWVRPKISSTTLFTFSSTSVLKQLDSDTEIYEWAVTTFGKPNDPSEPVTRWMRSNQTYFFKDAEDRLVFVMRWS